MNLKDALAEIADSVRLSGQAEGDARTRLTAFGRAYAEFYCTVPARATFRMVVSERRRFPDASGDLNALVLDISLACKAIARIVSFGELGDAFSSAAKPDAGG